MFEHFDDPIPAAPAPLDDVVARGNRLRIRRRMLAGATVMAVLVGGIVTAAALQGGGGHKVVVSNEASTTSTSDTTAPIQTCVPSCADTTSTTVDDTATTVDTPTTTDGNATATTVPGGDSTTTTTQAPHDPNDLSMVSVDYGPDGIEIPEGEAKPVTYTVTNNGPWLVYVGRCVDHEVDTWATPATQAWPPYTNGIWPQPYPARGAGQAPEVCADVVQLLAPGASYTDTETVLAGYRNQAGDVMPSPPGWTSFQASFVPQCTQPCARELPNSVPVQIEPPVWPAPASLYTIDVKTKHMAAASGQSTQAEITYTNGLAFAVRMPLFGPCWTLKSGTATIDCQGTLTWVVVGPHATVDLVGTVWARQDFAAAGAPLAAGRYPINLGDREDETLYYPPNDRVYLEVS